LILSSSPDEVIVAERSRWLNLNSSRRPTARDRDVLSFARDRLWFLERLTLRKAAGNGRPGAR
jgi:hypothetical protein